MNERYPCNSYVILKIPRIFIVLTKERKTNEEYFFLHFIHSRRERLLGTRDRIESIAELVLGGTRRI